MRRTQPPRPSYSLVNSPWLSASALLAGDFIKDMVGGKKEAEKHPLPIFFSSIVCKYVYGISETQ